MNNEIERKFLVKTMPDLSGMPKTSYERYYIYNANGIELRVQRKNDSYELERKVQVSDLERSREAVALTKVEFLALKPIATEVIKRDSYTLSITRMSASRYTMVHIKG